MSTTYRDSGVILQKYELGEADSLLTILLQHGGITRAVAKGARRQTSRKRGHIELFNQVDCLLAEGRNLDILTDVNSTDIFESWRQDLGRVSLIYYAADVTIMLLPELEPQPTIYSQLVQLLAWIGHAITPSAMIRWYEVQLLSNLGYWPPSHLESQSQNAIELLNTFSQASAQQVSSLKLSSLLANELERLMGVKFTEIVEKEAKSQKFVTMVREMP